MTWSKLELGWVLGASLVLSATACYLADWFYYVATMSFVLHFILLGRGQSLGFLFAGIGIVFYGLYCHRVGMAFHLGAQGLFLAVNLLGAVVWRYRFAFHKPFFKGNLTPFNDMVITFILIVGTGIVVYNMLTTGDMKESLRTLTILEGCLAAGLVIFGFRECWLLWMQVCSVGIVLWIMYYLHNDHGIPGVIAWTTGLLSVLICHYTHRKQ